MECFSSNPINFDHVSDLLQQLGSDNFIVLVHRFNLELESLISEISNFEVDRDDLDRLIAKVHQSAGSAAALGIIGLQKQLNLMESMAEPGKAETVRGELSKLIATWQTAKASLLEKGLMKE